MNKIFYSNWTTVLLTTGGWAAAFWYGYSKYGLTQHIKLGILMMVAFQIWMVWERYGTYLKIEDNRWLINCSAWSGSSYRIDIGSVLYIARMPHFIFRSWGGRTVIFFRDDTGEVKQTAFPETLYSLETLKAILKELTAIKPMIELDPQYASLLNARDNSVEEDLSQQLPRSVNEIEAYVAEKYGPPGDQVVSYRVRVLIQIALATGLLFFAAAVLILT